MAGKKSNNIRKFRLAILLFAVLLFPPAPEAAMDLEPGGPVYILVSDREKAYTQPVQAFIEEIAIPVRTINLEGDIRNAPQVMGKILDADPVLIFALGAKAAYIAKVWTSDRQEIPVIFAMVLNWQRYGLLEGQNNIAGIETDVAAGTQLANMLLFSKEIKHIGLIYSREHSGYTFPEIQTAASTLGVELVTREISDPGDFKRAFKKISGRIEGFLLLPDPVIFTLENINWLEERCIREKLVCAGPSENIARLGFLLSLNPDTANLGGQAATIAKSIINGRRVPSEIGVMPPLGTRLFLNRKTARRIELPLSSSVLDMASDIID